VKKKRKPRTPEDAISGGRYKPIRRRYVHILLFTLKLILREPTNPPRILVMGFLCHRESNDKKINKNNNRGSVELISYTIINYDASALDVTSLYSLSASICMPLLHVNKWVPSIKTIFLVFEYIKPQFWQKLRFTVAAIAIHLQFNHSQRVKYSTCSRLRVRKKEITDNDVATFCKPLVYTRCM